MLEFLLLFAISLFTSVMTESSYSRLNLVEKQLTELRNKVTGTILSTQLNVKNLSKEETKHILPAAVDEDKTYFMSAYFGKNRLYTPYAA